MSPSWRYGWLLVGVVGLMLLVNWPDPKHDPGTASVTPPVATETIGGRQTRLEALQEPWLEALWQPQPPAVSRILANGMDPGGILDELQNTPLHLLFIGQACLRGQRPTAAATSTVLQLLLAAGADPNARDSNGNTPLMLAVAHCDARVITELIGAGADPDSVNQRGLTAFEMTLSNPGDAAYALLQAGFQLPAGKLEEYREIYADETRVIALLDAASGATVAGD